MDWKLCQFVILTEVHWNYVLIERKVFVHVTKKCGWVILPNKCVGKIAWIKHTSVFDRISILFHQGLNFLRTLTRRSPWACRQCCSESRRCTASRETVVRSWSCDNSPPSRLQRLSYLRYRRTARGALYAGEECDWWIGCLGHVSQFASSHSMYLYRPV